MADHDGRDWGTKAAFLMGCVVGCLVTLAVVGSYAYVQVQYTRAVAAEEVIRAEQAAAKAQQQAEKARQNARPPERMPQVGD